MPDYSQETDKLDCVEPLQRVRKNSPIAWRETPLILHSSRPETESPPPWAGFLNKQRPIPARASSFLLKPLATGRQPFSERGRKYQHAAMWLTKEGSLEGGKASSSIYGPQGPATCWPNGLRSSDAGDRRQRRGDMHTMKGREGTTGKSLLPGLMGQARSIRHSARA